MKTLGIIGGIGPESTIDYYRQIISAYRKQKADGSAPAIIINSVDLHKLLDWMAAGEGARVAQYLVAAIEKLAAAGADFGVVAANTFHAVFDEVERGSPIPLISIVVAALDAARELRLKKVGLFGTRFTMQGKFYSDVFSKAGIALVAPKADEQDYIHEKYMSELVKGLFLPQTRESLLGIVNRMKGEERIEGLILGGTELPLILRDGDCSGIPFLDTTQLHVKAILSRMLAAEEAETAPAL